jgi:hypothetical protein
VSKLLVVVTASIYLLIDDLKSTYIQQIIMAVKWFLVVVVLHENAKDV